MHFKPGMKIKVRRNPTGPLCDVLIVSVVAFVEDNDKLGVRVTVEILEDGLRPNEQIELGIFHLKLWMEFAAK